MKQVTLALCVCCFLAISAVSVAEAANSTYFDGVYKVFNVSGQYVGDNVLDVDQQNGPVLITHPNGQKTNGVFVSTNAGYQLRVAAWSNAVGMCTQNNGPQCLRIEWAGGNQASSGLKWERK